MPSARLQTYKLKSAAVTFRAPESVNPIDWGRLGVYLATRGHQLATSKQPRQFAGGLGNWNFLVDMDGASYVLRRPPAGPLPPGANDMAREHRILQHLHPSFPLAPFTPLFCGDAAVIGAPFLLIEYRKGIVIRDALPAGVASTEQSRFNLARSALEVLIALHQIDPVAIGLGTLGRPEGMVQRQATNWGTRAEIAFGGTMPALFREVSEWLSNTAPAPQKISLLHSDFKLDNIIFNQETLQPEAVIDWDMGTLGDPLLDVATLLSYWTEPGDPPAMHQLNQMPTALPGFPTRAHVLQMYAERTGLDISQFRYYRVLALFKLCVVFKQLHARFERGEAVSPHYETFGPLSEGLIEFTMHVLQHENLLKTESA